jgi:hypothetical protein
MVMHGDTDMKMVLTMVHRVTYMSPFRQREDAVDLAVKETRLFLTCLTIIHRYLMLQGQHHPRFDSNFKQSAPWVDLLAVFLRCDSHKL